MEKGQKYRVIHPPSSWVGESASRTIDDGKFDEFCAEKTAEGFEFVCFIPSGYGIQLLFRRVDSED